MSDSAAAVTVKNKWNHKTLSSQHKQTNNYIYKLDFRMIHTLMIIFQYSSSNLVSHWQLSFFSFLFRYFSKTPLIERNIEELRSIKMNVDSNKVH